MTEQEARYRLARHDHGVLATLHAARGVDVVPVVYAVAGDLVGVPVDTVKAKASTRLQRQRNLEADPRAALLIEHWDPTDWSKLWWVRTELRLVEAPAVDAVDTLTADLAGRWTQYAERPFADLIVLRINGLSGWIA